MKLTDKWYEFFKKLVRIILPAVATLYFTLAQIWGLPNAEEVLGSITAFTLFLGVVLGVSNANYEGDGVIELSVDHDNKIVSVNKTVMPELAPEDLAKKMQVVLKVVNRSAA